MAATSGPHLVIVDGGFAGLFAARALDEMGTILWTAGIEAPPLAAAVARAPRAEQDRAGRLVCGKDLSLPGHPQIPGDLGPDEPGQAARRRRGRHADRALY